MAQNKEGNPVIGCLAIVAIVWFGVAQCKGMDTPDPPSPAPSSNNDGVIDHEDACNGLVIAAMEDPDNTESYDALYKRYCN